MKKILHLAATILSLAVLSGCQSAAPSVQSFDEIVASRRSIRSYDPSRKISEEQVRTLLQTALEAPSWANTETSKYYVALSEEKVAALKTMVGERNAQNVAGAPVMIVSTYVKGRAGFGRGTPTNEIGDGWGAYDNGLSNAFFILKAREQGFDTLIMGMRDSEAIRALLGIPEDEAVMAVISLGYRAESPNRPARKSIDEIAKFY